jgi:hypothetical protein
MQKNKINKTKKIDIKELTCAMCGKTKKVADYYQSFNSIHQTGKLPYCKQCLKDMCIDSKGNINIDNVKKMLKTIDRPFIYDVFKSSMEDRNDTIGVYMKNIALNNKSDGWKESEFEPSLDNRNENVLIDDIKFDVTKEMILKWGTKYEPEDYYELEKFYNDMEISNNIETAQDIVYLKKLAVISLKLDKALQDGDTGSAKQLGDLFSKYMADSKFRAMDKTDADKTGGVRNFCTIYSEVEKDGFIPPWEYYKKIKGIAQDIVDKTIMHIENFTLKLNKIEKMTTPPLDTPKLCSDEIDTENILEINDIDVDESNDYTEECEDEIMEGEENGIME